MFQMAARDPSFISTFEEPEGRREEKGSLFAFKHIFLHSHLVDHTQMQERKNCGLYSGKKS